MAYSRIHLILLESRLLRGTEGSSLLMHAPSTLLLSHFTFLFSLFFHTLFSSLFFVSLLSCYFFSLAFLCSLLAFRCSFFLIVTTVHCAQLRPFHTACHYEFYCFTPQLLLPRCRYHSQTTHWFVGCSAITTILCWLCHVPFPDKRVLFYFLTLCGIPIQIRVGYFFLLTPMACT